MVTTDSPTATRNRRRPARALIAAVVENMRQNLETLRYSTLAPSRYVVYVHAAEYARRLRTIKARAASQLADATITRVVTVHDGYGYLLQEFGLEVGGVVQPSHGLTPSAGELRDMVALLRREKITVVFSEATFPEPLLRVLRDEAGVSVFIISHIASGPFTADKFEREMQQNVDTMIRALVK